jgi:hypothetical protein
MENKTREDFEQYALKNLPWYSTTREFLELPFDQRSGVLSTYLRKEFQIVLCMYSNATTFLWAVCNIGGTDAGWSGLRRSRGHSDEVYEEAFMEAFNLITKMSFDDYHKSKYNKHCSLYVKHLKTL